MLTEFLEILIVFLFIDVRQVRVRGYKGVFPLLKKLGRTCFFNLFFFISVAFFEPCSTLDVTRAWHLYTVALFLDYKDRWPSVLLGKYFNFSAQPLEASSAPLYILLRNINLLYERMNLFINFSFSNFF